MGSVTPEHGGKKRVVAGKDAASLWFVLRNGKTKQIPTLIWKICLVIRNLRLCVFLAFPRVVFGELDGPFAVHISHVNLQFLAGHSGTRPAL